MIKSVVFIAFIAALSGFLFGYDTGVISGAILFIKKAIVKKRAFSLGSPRCKPVFFTLKGSNLGNHLRLTSDFEY